MANPFKIKPLKVNTAFGLNPAQKKAGTSKAILRRAVFKRDNGTCQLCMVKIRQNEVWDLARNRAGQPYTLGNCFVAHHDCNISQGRKTKGATRRGIGLVKRKVSKRKHARRQPSNPFGLPNFKNPFSSLKFIV